MSYATCNLCLNTIPFNIESPLCQSCGEAMAAVPEPVRVLVGKLTQRIRNLEDQVENIPPCSGHGGNE